MNHTTLTKRVAKHDVRDIGRSINQVISEVHLMGKELAREEEEEAEEGKNRFCFKKLM